MSYTAEISRGNPMCFLLLLDQSGSMSDPFPALPGTRKADGVADATNKILQELVLKCAKEEGVRDYFHIGVIGYGASVGPALSGPLAGRDTIPISEIGNNPARTEDRKKKIPDGAGGIFEQTVRFPIWVDPVTNGGTPMAEAFRTANTVLDAWIRQHAGSFPPIVMNITDGEPTGDDPKPVADAIRKLRTSDGEALLFNLHISSNQAAPVLFPDSAAGLPDDNARLLFDMSSPLPPPIIKVAQAEGIKAGEGTRGFVFNGDFASVVTFLNIGTRPSNLR